MKKFAIVVAAMAVMSGAVQTSPRGPRLSGSFDLISLETILRASSGADGYEGCKSDAECYPDICVDGTCTPMWE